MSYFLGFLSLLKTQLFNKPVYPTGSYSGKTIVVTGSNTGLGKEASRHFARLGVTKLILAVRNLDKGNAAKKDIEATTHCGKDVIEVWQVDMASYDSVKKFAKRINENLDRLDIFMANAGVDSKIFKIVEKDETNITINVVSTFLLSLLILPKMKETAAKFHVHPTLSLTASKIHIFTKFPAKIAPEGKIFKTLSDKDFAKKHWSEQYSVSKLLDIFGVRSIGEKYPNLPVTVNCSDPGFCHSGLEKEISGVGFSIFEFLVARPTEVGCRNLVYAASQGPESHGKYLSDCAITEPSSFVRSEEGKKLQKRVWKELTEKLEDIQPGIMSVLATE